MAAAARRQHQEEAQHILAERPRPGDKRSKSCRQAANRWKAASKSSTYVRSASSRLHIVSGDFSEHDREEDRSDGRQEEWQNLLVHHERGSFHNDSQQRRWEVANRRVSGAGQDGRPRATNTFRNSRSGFRQLSSSNSQVSESKWWNDRFERFWQTIEIFFVGKWRWRIKYYQKTWRIS